MISSPERWFYFSLWLNFSHVFRAIRQLHFFHQRFIDHFGGIFGKPRSTWGIHIKMMGCYISLRHTVTLLFHFDWSLLAGQSALCLVDISSGVLSSFSKLITFSYHCSRIARYWSFRFMISSSLNRSIISKLGSLSWEYWCEINLHCCHFGTFWRLFNTRFEALFL